MRKVFLFLALLGFTCSLIVTFLINERLVKNRITNCEKTVFQFMETSNKMLAILDDMSTAQNEFVKKSPITLSSIQEFLSQSLTMSAASLYDRDGKLVASYEWHADGPITENIKPHIDAIPFIQEKSYGWVNCIFETTRSDATFLFLSPIYDSFSKTPISYIACEYHVYPIIQLINDLFITQYTYAYIVGKDNKTILNPYYKPGTQATPFSPSIFLGPPDKLSMEIANSDDWLIVMQFDRPEMLGISKDTLRVPLFLLFCWGISLLFLLGYFWKANKGSLRSLWGLSLTFSGLICTAIGFLLYYFIVLTPSPLSPVTFFQVLDEIGSADKNKPIEIPTSFMISSLSFPDSTSFTVDGYITQVYPHNSTIQRGFTLPQQSGGGDSTITELSRSVSGNEEKITYHFNLLLRQPFSQKSFPFDIRTLKIILWPLEESREILFIPDINVYESLFPSDRAGLSDNIKLVGWEIASSLFLYTEKTSYFQWTIDSFVGKKALTFSISAQRNLVDVFISTFFPLFICEILTFILIMIPLTKLKDPTLASFANLLAIIFVVIINQMDFHKTLGVNAFAYIEYLYFFFYAQVAFLSANIVLLTTYEWHIPIVRYRDNLISQLIYWPSFLGTLLIILYTSFFT